MTDAERRTTLCVLSGKHKLMLLVSKIDYVNVVVTLESMCPYCDSRMEVLQGGNWS